MAPTAGARVALLVCLLLGALVNAWAAGDPPLFRLPDSGRLSFTQKQTYGMEITSMGEKATQNFILTTRNVLSVDPDGGYLLDVTVKSFAVTLDGKAPTTYTSSDLVGLRVVLELDEKGIVNGYHDDVTTEAWIDEHLPEAQVAKMKAARGEWDILEDAFRTSRGLDHLEFLDRPATLGARWFSLEHIGEDSNGDLPPFSYYAGYTVGKRVKAGGRDCLRVDACYHHDPAQLAKAMACTVREIEDGVGGESPYVFPEDFAEPGMTGKSTYVVDPTSMRCYSAEGQGIYSIRFDFSKVPRDEADPDMPRSLTVSMRMQVKETYTYE